MILERCIASVILAGPLVAGQVPPAPDQVEFERSYDHHLRLLSEAPESGNALRHEWAISDLEQFLSENLAPPRYLDGWLGIVLRVDTITHDGNRIAVAVLETRDPGHDGLRVACLNDDPIRSGGLSPQFESLAVGDVVSLTGEVLALGQDATTRTFFDTWAGTLGVLNPTVVPYGIVVRTHELRVIDIEARRRPLKGAMQQIRKLLPDIDETTRMAALLRDHIEALAGTGFEWWHGVANGTRVPQGVDSERFREACLCIDPGWRIAEPVPVDSTYSPWTPEPAWDEIEHLVRPVAPGGTFMAEILTMATYDPFASDSSPHCRLGLTADARPFAPPFADETTSNAFEDIVTRHERFCTLLQTRKLGLDETEILKALEADVEWSRAMLEIASRHVDALKIVAEAADKAWPEHHRAGGWKTR